jgi:hypothetical protein
LARLRRSIAANPAAEKRGARQATRWPEFGANPIEAVGRMAAGSGGQALPRQQLASIFITKGSRSRCFEHIRTITATLVFPTWTVFLDTLITSKPPPELRSQTQPRKSRGQMAFRIAARA